MKKSNPNQSHNHNPKRRKKNDPRYKREIVGYRLIPMQAQHVDQIDATEGSPTWWNSVAKGPRCPKCFLRLRVGRSTHFCRWNIAREGPRDHDPPILRVPICRWVLRKDGSR